MREDACVLRYVKGGCKMVVVVGKHYAPKLLGSG